MEKEYYSIKEVQSILGCGKQKVYNLVKLKSFPATKIGKVYYINKREFESWERRNLYSEILINNL